MIPTSHGNTATQQVSELTTLFNLNFVCMQMFNVHAAQITIIICMLLFTIHLYGKWKYTYI